MRWDVLALIKSRTRAYCSPALFDACTAVPCTASMALGDKRYCTAAEHMMIHLTLNACAWVQGNAQLSGAGLAAVGGLTELRRLRWHVGDLADSSWGPGAPVLDALRVGPLFPNQTITSDVHGQAAQGCQNPASRCAFPCCQASAMPMQRCVVMLVCTAPQFRPLLLWHAVSPRSLSPGWPCWTSLPAPCGAPALCSQCCRCARWCGREEQHGCPRSWSGTDRRNTTSMACSKFATVVPCGFKRGPAAQH